MSDLDLYGDLSLYEEDTERFTTAERTGIAVYVGSVHHGLHDCFDQFTPEFVADHESQFGREYTYGMLREHAAMLAQWAEAVDTLLGDLLTCTSERTHYRPCAHRYITAAAEDYHLTRAAFEYAVTVYTLGLTVGAPTSSARPYPAPTRAVNFPMQTLTNE